MLVRLFGRHTAPGLRRKSATPTAPVPRIRYVKPDPAVLQERIARIPIERYRNFLIVAHVDHGKLTLLDRLLELTGVIPPGAKQVLDKLDVERERGITVKAQTCSILYNHNGADYLLHLVDTPGHVDFRAEVLRLYASCQGALLIVDALQGVQAQTVANFFLAYSMDLKMVPVINKIDLPAADIESAREQVEQTFELDPDDCIPVSAKTGLHVEDILPAVVERIPPPSGDPAAPLKALLVDSWYDTFLGVVMLVYVSQGTVRKGMKLSLVHAGHKLEAKDVGIMYPNPLLTGQLLAGQVGYIIPGLKNAREALVGDTILEAGVSVEPLPGFEEPKPMVFVGAFPADGMEFTEMDDHMQHLVLNDRLVTLQRELLNALGQGWRLGFLGLLHASVFKERLEKEYGAAMIITNPTVPYRLQMRDGLVQEVRNPDDFPEHGTGGLSKVAALLEPMVDAIITTPDDYLGKVMKVCDDSRGRQQDLQYLTKGQVMLRYRIPLATLADNFVGRLKGLTQGYASLDYEDGGYEQLDIVKMELLINGVPVDALLEVMHRSEAQLRGRDWVTRFREHVANQLFEVAIQARAGGRIVARESVRARRKDVLQKLHAADISRRKKLLSKQKEGKKAMKGSGRVSIDKLAYQAFLRR